MNLLQRLRWKLKYGHGPKRFDRETGRFLYSKAPYCLDCHEPVMSFGTVCKKCLATDRL